MRLGAVGGVGCGGFGETGNWQREHHDCTGFTWFGNMKVSEVIRRCQKMSGGKRGEYKNGVEAGPGA